MGIIIRLLLWDLRELYYFFNNSDWEGDEDKDIISVLCVDKLDYRIFFFL